MSSMKSVLFPRAKCETQTLEEIRPQPKPRDGREKEQRKQVLLIRARQDSLVNQALLLKLVKFVVTQVKPLFDELQVNKQLQDALPAQREQILFAEHQVNQGKSKR